MNTAICKILLYIITARGPVGNISSRTSSPSQRFHEPMSFWGRRQELLKRLNSRLRGGYPPVTALKFLLIKKTLQGNGDKALKQQSLIFPYPPEIYGRLKLTKSKINKTKSVLIKMLIRH